MQVAGLGRSSARDGWEQGHGFAVVQALILVGVPTVDEDDGDLGRGNTDLFDEIAHMRAFFKFEFVLVVGVFYRKIKIPGITLNVGMSFRNLKTTHGITLTNYLDPNVERNRFKSPEDILTLWNRFNRYLPVDFSA